MYYVRLCATDSIFKRLIELEALIQMFFAIAFSFDIMLATSEVRYFSKNWSTFSLYFCGETKSFDSCDFGDVSKVS